MCPWWYPHAKPKSISTSSRRRSRTMLYFNSGFQGIQRVIVERQKHGICLFLLTTVHFTRCLDTHQSFETASFTLPILGTSFASAFILSSQVQMRFAIAIIFARISCRVPDTLIVVVLCESSYRCLCRWEEQLHKFRRSYSRLLT